MASIDRKPRDLVAEKYSGGRLSFAWLADARKPHDPPSVVPSKKRIRVSQARWNELEAPFNTFQDLQIIVVES